MQRDSIRRVTLEKDGTTLDCVRFGHGGRALVLIPGLSFQRVRDAALPLALMYRGFSKTHTVYVFDKKAAVPSGYTIEDMAEDTAFMMERLGIASADVVGISQGGMIAQALAIRYPQLVHKLVLGVTASRVNPVMEDVVRGWVEMAERGDYAGIVLDMFPKMYSDAYLEKRGWLLPMLSRVGKPKDLSRFAALARACLTCGCYPELQRIRCPVFVIGGRDDRVVTGEASAEIARALGCAIYLYDALGHGAYEEAPDFNSRIARFLCGCD